MKIMEYIVKKFSVNFKLGKGDLLILNNNYVAHGRTKFAIEKIIAED